jgi:WhiB family redox-sensing transcriptional regulator
VAAVASETRNPAAIAMRQTWDLDINWQFEARCRGSDANLFFSPTHLESKDERQHREALAKSVCSECRVRRQCLEFALETRETHGIWGGLNELERRHALARKAV